VGNIKLKMGYCPDCGNTEPKPLIKGSCNFHYWQSKRKPIERKPVKIKPVADKRLKELAKYRIERDKFLKGKTCMFPGCESQECDLHHSNGRSGAMIYKIKFFRALCREHHQYIELHPEEAKKLGLSVNRLEK